VAEIVSCASAHGGKDVEQLEQDREFGDEHDGRVKDLELIDNLAPSVTPDRARTMGQSHFEKAHDFDCRDVPLVDKAAMVDDLIPNRSIDDIANLSNTPSALLPIFRYTSTMPTQANNDKSMHNPPVSGMLPQQRFPNNLQSSQPRPVLLMNLFVYVRMRTRSVVTVSVITVVATMR